MGLFHLFAVTLDWSVCSGPFRKINKLKWQFQFLIKTNLHTVCTMRFLHLSRTMYSANRETSSDLINFNVDREIRFTVDFLLPFARHDCFNIKSHYFVLLAAFQAWNAWWFYRGSVQTHPKSYDVIACVDWLIVYFPFIATSRSTAYW